jgi:hypothetical protein
MTAEIAISVTWGVLAVLLFSWGQLTIAGLRFVSTRFEGQHGGLPQVWLGLAGLTLYLQVWSLFAPVSGLVWLLPICAAALGCVTVAWHRLRFNARLAVAAIAIAVLTIWFANQSGLAPANYDTGLYHFNAIDFAHEYGTVPGLGNLHTRLGTSISHFLVVAFVGAGPWSGAGYHLVNGGIAVLLGVDLITRLTGVRSGAANSRLSRVLAAVLLPSLILLASVGPATYVSSPSLDFPAFALAVGSALYLLDAGVKREASIEALVGLALLATLVTSRFQFLPSLLVASLLVALCLRRTGESALNRATLVMFAMPVATVAVCAIRTVVLSGYPFFPATLGGLPVRWRVPRVEAVDTADWVKSWARTPGSHPDDVLGSWAWFRPWLHRSAIHPFIDPMLNAFAWTAVLGVLAMLLGILVRKRAGLPPVAPTRLHVDHLPLALMIVPNVVTLIVWFLTAPDPRFAFAPLVLVPLGLVAAVDQKMAAGSATAGTFGVASCLAALVALTVLTSGNLSWRSVSGKDPFGTADPFQTETITVTTASGIQLLMPATGDQCWRAIPCTPNPPDDLYYRGDEIGDGFQRTPTRSQVP